MFNVLFVCIGNSCRSQMAEGFAHRYGGDVLQAWSAGLAPASLVQPQTIQVMSEKNIDIREQFPKSIYELDLTSFDVIANMSGGPLPAGIPGELLTWDVEDPMTQPEEVYIAVREQIESLVMQLILELRRTAKNQAAAPLAAPPARPAPKAAPNTEPATAAESPQRFRFGRVRKARD